jgi:hypothetical protein
MVTYTEGNHDAEFIMSEANFHRSRDNAELASGQNLAAGTVVGWDGGQRLIAWSGDEFTNGEEDEVAGILINATDATDGHKKVAIIARDAEVQLSLLTYPAAKEAVMVQSLKRLGIIPRS